MGKLMFKQGMEDEASASISSNSNANTHGKFKNRKSKHNIFNLLCKKFSCYLSSGSFSPPKKIAN